jgi:hypothetical protein
VIGKALQMPARLAQLDALAHDLADGELAPDERVQVDPACQDVAPRRLVRELDPGVRPEALERLRGDQRQLLVGRYAARVEVSVAFEALAGDGSHTVDEHGKLLVLAGDSDLLYGAAVHRTRFA